MTHPADIAPAKQADPCAFHVPDMTCNHCVKAITQEINGAFPTATVFIDLPNHRVQVTGASSSDGVRKAIEDAGYDAQGV